MQKDRITVCICTFRRPELLAKLLTGVANQVLPPGCATEIVVVDNDGARSAEPVVTEFRRSSPLPVVYEWEPERNISLARNRAVRAATGTLIAFIDDDEYPVPDWLSAMYRTMKAHGADGVLGPVLPDLPPAAPRWLKRGGFLERRRLATGARIGPGDARTGNVLLHRSLFASGNLWFDPAFGRSGGEDSDFFARQFDRGRIFLWCDEAAVHEIVPPERWKSSYYIRRHRRSGTLDGQRMRAGALPGGMVIARSAVIFCGGLVVAPLCLLAPTDVRTRVWRKVAYCAGLLTAYWGLPLSTERE